jgi:pilus assembly protein Flp/PilA
MAILVRFLKNEDGVTAIEYALIAGLIALAIVAAVQLVDTRVSAVGRRRALMTHKGVSKRWTARRAASA